MNPSISPATIIVSLALMLSAGFVMTRITKLVRLPNVTGYILAGILLGPYCFNVIPAPIISGMDFLSDIALAFIAFSVGEFFKFSTLKKNGLRVVVITVMEACMASVVVFIAVYFFLGLSLPFAIMLAALASATAPASTMMTIRQTHAKGDLVDTLLQVVALDDVVGLIAYSIAISIALSAISPGSSSVAELILKPLFTNIGVFVLGGLFGLLIKLFMIRKHSTDNRLIIAIAVLFLFCGICASLDVSPLLGCMSMGTVYINTSGDDKLFKQLNYFSPPVLLLFFVRSGLSFQLDALFSSQSAVAGVSLMVVSVVYFLTRIIGKYAGAYLGCLITHKPSSVRRYLGLGLIPQAGVAIGLAAMCARMLGGGLGQSMQTVILASSVLYEMIGPACAKLALYLSKSYSNTLEDLTTVTETAENGEQRAQIDILIDRIQQLQAEISATPPSVMSEEEAAFEQAAEEQYVTLNAARHTRHAHTLFR